MNKFDIKTSLKNHYLFEYPIFELIDTFIIVFNEEKKQLLRVFVKGLESIYGEQNFSSTIFNISDIIVFKYFNSDLSFSQKAFIRSNKFKEYPFSNKIKQLTKQ